MTKQISKNISFGNSQSIAPLASVVIVCYQISPTDFKATIRALEKQTEKNFEIIVIDNGNDWDIHSFLQQSKLAGRYLKLKENYGLNIGRNMGAKEAKGDILIFLDDDGLPANDFVEEHLRAYQENSIVALRGKVAGRTKTILNCLQKHYDLGDQVIPYHINTEGNSSFKRKLFLELAGVDERLQGAGGHEGAEISYRIVEKYNDRNKIIYYPKAVIYHDYADSLLGHLRKQARHEKYGNMLKNENPKLFQFIKSYPKPKDAPQLNFFQRASVKVIKMIERIYLKFTKL